MAEQEESQRPCVMCRESNEQMLMLSCVHDPCVNCAAVQYVENEPQNSPVTIRRCRAITAPSVGRERSLILPAWLSCWGFTACRRTKRGTGVRLAQFHKRIEPKIKIKMICPQLLSSLTPLQLTKLQVIRLRILVKTTKMSSWLTFALLVIAQYAPNAPSTVFTRTTK